MGAQDIASLFVEQDFQDSFFNYQDVDETNNSRPKIKRLRRDETWRCFITKNSRREQRLMHLLNVKTRKLEYFSDGTAPKYGILSHTWDQNEPTFDDFQSSSRRWKLRIGSRNLKINGCCARAASDGLGHIWIDNCCIDKKSSAELSEAINSMFTWYANAAVCYVYLGDLDPMTQPQARTGVQPPSLSTSQLDELEKARWFTRGWTLQELLAPSLLKFYDSTWNLVGYSSWINADGNTTWKVPRITTLLAEITGIPRKYLQGETLGQASVAEKMSWAASRQTTRREDMAYCLLGIFGVNMPLLYGEGMDAFVRLQEEILKKHDDHSVFAWGYNNDYFIPEQTGNGGPSMALSPAKFRWCGEVTARRPEDVPSNHYETTNVGIHIKLPLIQLRSGEYLARLNCTVDSDQPDILLEDKYLALILTQSRDQENVFYRRSTTSLTLVPVRFFEQALRHSIYLAPTPSVTHRQMRNAPLFVSAACSKLFSVQYTYPDILDIHEGVYTMVSDLWKHLKNGNAIFLDCISVTGQKFAIQVQFFWGNDDSESGSNNIASAYMSLSYRRHVCSMVELMLPPEAADVPDMSWEANVVIEGQQIVLEPAESNQWSIELAL
ncbi:hypothetical protein AK830_g4658 [Neonectria ditissima]|uniref:Uncharacterized protein n=1 Tax=Neonectria ditissima TaxID=78410 RepID=A0A0P7B7V0_9HYPO|nr:hypothetical protein AK830_g4658 [Neonectria ditissima]